MSRRCGDGGGGTWSEEIAASFCASSGVFSKLTFSYWAINLNAIIYPDAPPTPPGESNLQLYPGEYFAFWDTLGQCNSPCDLKRICYTIHWEMFSLHCRIQSAVCNKLWNLCVAGAAFLGSLSWSAFRLPWHSRAGEDLNDIICFSLPPRSWFQEKGPASSPQTRFSSYPWLKRKSKVTAHSLYWGWGPTMSRGPCASDQVKLSRWKHSVTGYS